MFIRTNQVSQNKNIRYYVHVHKFRMNDYEKNINTVKNLQLHMTEDFIYVYVPRYLYQF